MNSGRSVVAEGSAMALCPAESRAQQSDAPSAMKSGSWSSRRFKMGRL